MLDNAVGALVGLATAAVAAFVAARARRILPGLYTGAWSGLASGLGACLGGAVLLAGFRRFVERDPPMALEFQQRGQGVGLATYGTQETMIGAAGHLWVLGIGPGALLGLVAAPLTIGVMRLVPRD